jgi:hypothetical protein
MSVNRNRTVDFEGGPEDSMGVRKGNALDVVEKDPATANRT